ncbi:fimbrial protein [Serratia fonticola]|uniref:hypothetical protein n=1 Tax=Serratia fonticola TaxID=47917 RepID=UPI0015772F93|nr:hypothetical protein [Serratia fonticola]NTY85953.1 fimbrial protein [Serratia fonticola]NTZ11844.1 fimbrial protein [Serratia fonticola]
MMKIVKRRLQRQIKILLTALVLALCSLINRALAAEDLMVCNWEHLNGDFVKLTSGSFRDVIEPYIEWKKEEDQCNEYECTYRNYWDIPNRTYTVTASAAVRCINMGNKTGPIRFSFERAFTPKKPTYYKNLTMKISGAGSLSLSGLENMWFGTIRNWSDGTLAPCQIDCRSMSSGWPQYYKVLSFTFTVRPIKSRVEFEFGPKPNFDNINLLGNIWVHQSSDNPGMSYYGWGSTSIPGICGLMNSDMSDCIPSSGGGGAGPIKPPTPVCTLTITTPGVVEFQPISSDDLSRNRVRMEDFTLTATKGPVQSQTCIGSVYNLPGTIKTEGGYSISNTFWGINHSSGSPQGIGLKLYDLGKGSYLQFNHTYPSFIANISSMSETKRIRAEIAATTNDLKRIKDGEYSQVLIFEVKMP